MGEQDVTFPFTATEKMRTRRVCSEWGGSLEHGGFGFPSKVSCKTLGLPSSAPRTWFFQLIQTLSAYSFICTMGKNNIFLMKLVRIERDHPSKELNVVPSS